MPELRLDPIQKRWVIIATERQNRRTWFDKELTLPGTQICPFCTGNEALTPPEILAHRSSGISNDSSWTLRVIPNKFPALQIEGTGDRRADGIYDRMNGIGAHEVVIESTNHVQHMADMPLDQVASIFEVYRLRLADLMKDPRFKYVMIFKNHGSDAGASIAHPHTQIIATPVTPKTVSLELDSAREHFHHKERCIFCDIMDEELSHGERLVYMSDHFVALCPYASRFPYEVIVLPRTHAHDYSVAPDHIVRDLAHTMQVVLAKLRMAVNDPPFNYLFHTSPNPTHARRRANYWDTLAFDWHWHVEVLPRLTKTAGFEWGSGFYINPTPPELAADNLRRAKVNV
ncbi:MAG: galactose-1-phosphate uridylyltransferase [Candidatus Cloacimonetes bacterium]|nr:galactose-1-phosphate uridylyltransferase [Candidatus Cloacimonadota bacterium]